LYVTSAAPAPSFIALPLLLACASFALCYEYCLVLSTGVPGVSSTALYIILPASLALRNFFGRYLWGKDNNPKEIKFVGALSRGASSEP
jgi:hypothetical protein